MFMRREKRVGAIAPDERLPWPNTVALGMQHVLAMFGATFLAPLLMGFDPQLAILFSGIGTLVFVVGITLIIGAGGYVVQIGAFTFEAIGPWRLSPRSCCIRCCAWRRA